LHIGGVRTALYNYLFAGKQGGDLILRIEDTDTQRFVPGAEAYIVETFRWLNIPFDEGPGLGGSYGPYRQSERKPVYRRYVQQLLETEKAYYAFDTPEELEAKRAAVANFQYDASTRMQMRNSLTMSGEETRRRLEEGTGYVVRFRVEEGELIRVNDLVRGEVTVHSSVLDDKVLYKSSDGLPTYHLANVVDDRLMEITHVIRGEEWLPSAPLHVLLYRALGWEASMPQFAHLPLLLKPDGNGKLSKRDGDRLGFPVFPLAWSDDKGSEPSPGFREQGFLYEALLNFLALTGWNPGDDREILSRDEMMQCFDLAHCSKNGARFDYEKGKWFNHQYLRAKDNKALAELFLPLLKARGLEAEAEYVEKVVGLVKERAGSINELWEHGAFFFAPPDGYDEKTVKKRWKETSPQQLSELARVLASCERFDALSTEQTVKEWMESRAYAPGVILNALRLALTGEGKGPHLFDMTALLGREETLRRIHRAIEQLP
jgi:glutamyl-tRNA synthetase